MQTGPKEIRKIPPRIDPATFTADLDKLVDTALDAGADDAGVISVADVVFDPEIRVRVKASARYRSYHWPAVYRQDSVEDAVCAFHRGILFRIITKKDFPGDLGVQLDDPRDRKTLFQTFKIAQEVETAAFYMGYHLATGFAAGNCRGIFCLAEIMCEATIKGRVCRHPYKARPSMEAVGLDARAMAGKLGWKEIPDRNKGFVAGIVFIA